MCGILGWVAPEPRPALAQFNFALDEIAHRGPDDRGVYADETALIGHRRLAILDLTPAGHQPMIDPGSGAVIVFNGEIYNYIELRAELVRAGHVFLTSTDTEVLLKAFLHWGHDCLARLNGMWAFAVWMPTARRLFFARDRFGVKPLYYTVRPSSFAFASEAKSLLRLAPELRAVDHRTLYRFLALGLLYNDGGSFYQGVRVIEPAHCGEYIAGDAALRIWRYWDYPQEPKPIRDVRAEAEHFSTIFDDAVRLRLRADVKVGITLSGGIDSTAILTAAMKSASNPMVCFTSVYGPRDRGEAPWAQLAAQPYGLTPIEVTAPRDAWLETMQRIAWHMDGPGYSPAVYPLWRLMAQARKQGVPVLLEGQGADECVGGYPQYGVIGLLETLRDVLRLRRGAGAALMQTWSALIRIFPRAMVMRWIAREVAPGLINMYRRRVGIQSVLRPEFTDTAKNASWSETRRTPPPHLDVVTQRLWSDFAFDILPGLLQYGDAISMAHAIESRLPFMDYRLVEWLFERPSVIKVRDGRTKWVLREYLNRYGPSAIAARPDKLGYPTPIDRWLADDGGACLRDLLLDRNARIREFCERREIRRLIDFHVCGGNGAGNHLYRLLSTELWLRQCVST